MGIIHLLHLWHHLEPGQRWMIVGLAVIVIWSVVAAVTGGGQ